MVVGETGDVLGRDGLGRARAIGAAAGQSAEAGKSFIAFEASMTCRSLL